MSITNQIHFRNVKGDIFGGVTAAVITLPRALTFGVASSAGTSAGLWGAILIGLFAALFGGTPTLISEAIGPMTVVLLGLIAGTLIALFFFGNEAVEKGRQVFLVVVGGQTEKPLRKLGVMEKIPPQNIIGDRASTLRQAVSHVDEHIVNSGRDTIDSQAVAYF
jgi:hypothetical protein